MKRTLFLRILLGFLAIIVLATALFVAFTLRLVGEESGERLASRLEAAALAVRAAVAEPAAARNLVAVRADAAAAAASTGVRLTVIAADGTVLADSEGDPAVMENHRGRPEVAAALEGRTGMSERWSSTLERDFVYVAVPSTVPGGAVVRAAAPKEDVARLAAPARTRVGLFALIILAAGLLGALAFSRRLTGPISLLTGVVARVAEGDFRARLHLRGGGEVRALAEGVNAMAERLQRQFEGLAAGAREMDALFASVPAGIAIIGADGRVTRSNPAFARLVGAPEPAGRSVWELTRDPGLMEAARLSRESGSPSAREIARAGRVLLAAVSPLERELVLVLQDVTDARRLEDTKRELVANVSHELRTPLTAIQGFLEMLEGEVQGDAARAVAVIARNARRMSAIVEDLLVLSRLESPAQRLQVGPVDLGALAADVARLYEPRARARGLALILAVPPDLPRPSADPHLVEQLLVNLVDNAVRYTERGSVTIGASAEDAAVSLWVEDTGIGIPGEHVDRIFERFYVVDPARSREMGGTGLGLAIVKHIAALHGGSVDVASRVGRGTRFTARLPFDRN
jgi:two-component system, OmpR family, phosphate regulon sensor histidine kinase PhoR